MTGCSELARSVLTTPTPHANVEETGDPTIDAQVYGVSETGQLNKANDKAVTGFNIINGCERRDEDVRRSFRPWYHRVLG